MKKLFTAFALASMAAFGANAAVTITVDGTVVKNGDVIVSNALEVDKEGDEIWLWELKPDFTIMATEETPFTMDVTNVGETDFQYCGVTLASADMSCHTITANETYNDAGTLQAGRTHSVAYDYQLPFGQPEPEEVKCYAHFKFVGGGETLEFDVNMIYPEEDGFVDGIGDDRFTLVVGNGRIASTDGAEVEVYTLDGARVANDGLSGIYVARVGGKAIKVAVK